MNWAFNLDRGKPLYEKWKSIPSNTDVLITHGLPMGILDKTITGKRVGCFDLMEKVVSLRPKYHLFGHIHEDYGKMEKDGTVFINACVCTEGYLPVNKQIVFEV